MKTGVEGSALLVVLLSSNGCSTTIATAFKLHASVQRYREAQQDLRDPTSIKEVPTGFALTMLNSRGSEHAPAVQRVTWTCS
ncbi:hypothetical protein ABKN59_007820 [Abortiporus biennis]